MRASGWVVVCVCCGCRATRPPEPSPEPPRASTSSEPDRVGPRADTRTESAPEQPVSTSPWRLAAETSNPEGIELHGLEGAAFASSGPMLGRLRDDGSVELDIAFSRGIEPYFFVMETAGVTLERWMVDVRGTWPDHATLRSEIFLQQADAPTLDPWFHVWAGDRWEPSAVVALPSSPSTGSLPPFEHEQLEVRGVVNSRHGDAATYGEKQTAKGDPEPWLAEWVDGAWSMVEPPPCKMGVGSVEWTDESTLWASCFWDEPPPVEGELYRRDARGWSPASLPGGVGSGRFLRVGDTVWLTAGWQLFVHGGGEHPVVTWPDTDTIAYLLAQWDDRPASDDCSSVVYVLDTELDRAERLASRVEPALTDPSEDAYPGVHTIEDRGTMRVVLSLSSYGPISKKARKAARRALRREGAGVLRVSCYSPEHARDR